MIFNICEALKNRDKQNDCKYDFLTTYQCNKYSNNTKRELIESLNNNCSDKKLELILSRTANAEEIDLSEKFLEQFDSLNEEDSKPLNIHYYALVNTVKENGISKPTILNVCTASSIDKALMFLDPVDSEHVVEISEQKYDDYFKGQDILDEGAIWDAVKNGVKGVADAVKNINAERKNTDSYRIKQEIKDKKKDLRVAKEMEKAAKDSAKYGYHGSDSSGQSNNSASSNTASNDTNNNSNSTSFKAGSNPTFNRSRTSSNPSREEVLSPELIQQLIDSGDEATLQNIKIQAEKARQEAKKNNDKLEAEEKARKKQEEEKARKAAEEARKAQETADRAAAEADRAAAEAQSNSINQNEEFTKMNDIFKALNEADDCINKETCLDEQDVLTYKNDQDLEEKVARRLRQIFIDFDVDSSETMQFSKWQEVVDWISSVIKQLKDTPLTEDLSQEEIHTSGISAYITDAINGEYDTINDYNEMLLALKDDSQDSAINVIEDIIKEEYTHIGQLQELLKMYASPSSEIKSGEVEAQKQIEDTDNNQSDSKFDNEFGLNSGFDRFI